MKAQEDISTFNYKSVYLHIVWMLLFCTAFSSIGFSQTNQSVSWFTDSEGLPQNSVKSIIKDKYGFVWFSTEDGLVRYDGNNFKIYNTSNVEGLQSARMVFFGGHKDKDSIFIRSGVGDLLLIHQRKIHYLKENHSKETLHLLDSISTISDLNEYQVMLSGHALFLDNVSMDYEQNLRTPLKRYLISNHKVDEVDFSNDKSFFYTFKETRERQFFTLDNSLYHLTKSGNIFEYKNGEQNLVHDSLAAETTIYTNYLADQVFMYKDGNMYLIKQIKNRQIEKQLLFKNINISETDISSAFYDDENHSLYLGTYAKGLAIVKNLPITGILDKKKNKDNIIYALTQVDDSTLITGTGTVIRDKKVIATHNFSQISNRYYLVNYENEGLWTADINQLFFLRKGENYQYKIAGKWQLSDSVRINLVQKKDEKNIWIATANWTQKNLNNLYYKSTALNDSTFHKVLTANVNITSLLEINRDSLYIGSKEDGLFLLTDYNSPKPKLKKIDEHKKVTGFYKNDKGIWITTYGQGFYLLKDLNLTPASLDKSGYLSTAHCMIEDEDHNIWIPTNRGLFKIPAANLEANINNISEKLFYNYFDKSYGLLTNEFNGGCSPCGVQMKNKRIYFPSMNGVVSFLPDEVTNTAGSIELFFDELKIDGENVELDDKLTLENPFERLEFRVAIPFYGARNNIHLEAALDDGYNSPKWMAFNPDEAISFTNLTPGTYQIKLRAQLESESQYYFNGLDLEIPPQFWQTLWFKILFLLILSILIFLGFFLRVKHITKEKQRLTKEVALRTKDLTETITQLGKTEKELKRQLSFQNSITRSISHDLKTPIKYLNIYCRQIYANPEEVEDREAIRLIYNTGDRIGKFVENLLIYAKANVQAISEDLEQTNLRELIEDRISFFEIPLLTQENSFENRVPDDLSIRTNVQVLKIIIQNILDNAIKNTQNGKIIVSCDSSSDQIHIKIQDTGEGIDAANLWKFNLFFQYTEEFDNSEAAEIINSPIGLGYRIIRHLLPYINGRIVIDSEERKGTSFNIYLG